MESIVLDDPLRAHADVLTEEPLQRSFAEIEPANHVFYPGDFTVGNDIVKKLVNHSLLFFLFWKPLTQKLFHPLDHHRFIFLKKQYLFQGGAIDTKGLFDAER